MLDVVQNRVRSWFSGKWSLISDGFGTSLAFLEIVGRAEVAILSELSASVIVGTASAQSLVLSVINWLLIGYTAFTFAPEVYPERVRGIVRRPLRHRIGLTVVILGGYVLVEFAVGYRYISGVDSIYDAAVSSVVAYFFVSMFLILIGSYIHWFEENGLFSPESKVLQMIGYGIVSSSSADPSEWKIFDQISRRRERGRVVYVFTVYLIFSMVAVYVLFPSLLLSGIIFGLNITFPLLELLVIVAAVGPHLWQKLSTGTRFPGTYLNNVEETFYRSVRLVWGGDHGMGAAGLCLGGMSISAGMISYSISRIFDSPNVYLDFFSPVLLLFTTKDADLTSSILMSWNKVGVLLCMFLPSLYWFWYWYRMVKRVPAFLFQWENIKNSTPSPTAEKMASSDIPARPSQLGVFASVMLFLLWAARQGRDIIAVFSSLDSFFPILWPVSLVMMIIATKKRIQYHQNVLTDRWLLPANFAFEYSATICVLLSLGLISPIYYSHISGVVFIFSPLVIFLYVYLYEEIEAWQNE